MTVVRDAVHAYGADALVTVALGRETEDGDTTVIAAGHDLADLALQEGTFSSPPSITH